MNFVKKNINDLKYANYNPRKKLKPEDKEYQKIKKSIEEFGYVDPIIINKDNTIIGGHQRLTVLKDLGYEEVDVIQIDIDKTKEKALNIALNKITGEWDYAMLGDLLLDLDTQNYDLEITGFDLDEIEDILAPIGEEKEVIEDDFDCTPPEEPKAKYGDIYQLEKHFLMCGDSTKEEDVAKLMNGNKADMVFTDPPYGMNAVSKSGVLSEKYKTDIMNDDDNTVAINSFNLCKNYFKDAKQVWWGANYYTECLPSAECWIVWDKNNGGSDQTDCELAWTNFRSVVRQFTMASEKINRVHPTQKPLNLIAQIFKKFDKNNEYSNIVDLFGGSGSTLIASEQLNRKCYMMELDCKYIQVIIERYIAFTGNKVYRLNDDGTKTDWEDIKCEKEK